MLILFPSMITIDDVAICNIVLFVALSMLTIISALFNFSNATKQLGVAIGSGRV